MPETCLGTSIVTNAIKQGIIILAVQENKSVLNAAPLKLGLKDDIIIMESYSDCLEFLRRI